jgi:hypothetical protein
MLMIASISNLAGTTENFKTPFRTGWWLKPVLKGVAVQFPESSL